MSGERTDLTLELHHESAGAWLVSESGEEDDAVWLPKSLADRCERVGKRDPVYRFEVEEWLAKDRGLL